VTTNGRIVAEAQLASLTSDFTVNTFIDPTNVIQIELRRKGGASHGRLGVRVVVATVHHLSAGGVRGRHIGG
jgi:hypothetical protein